MTLNQPFLQNLYDAFNKRDIETIIAFMHPEVKWANGLDGGFVYGRDAVRHYWSEQLKEVQPHLEALQFEIDEQHRDVVMVHQVIKDLQGNTLVDMKVKQMFTIEEGLISLYELEAETTIKAAIHHHKNSINMAG